MARIVYGVSGEGSGHSSRAMVPRPDVSLVTTFYFGEPRNDCTFLFPPILREAVLAITPADKGHILVYLTSGFASFLQQLKAFPREHFIVYGCGDTRREANLVFKPPSRDGFLQDLASCRAVMATAGYTLITEALHLRKPYLALPMQGQFEQEINAVFLARMGCGCHLREVTNAAIAGFLERLPEYRLRLADYPVSDSRAILETVDRLLADDGRLARAFHRRRTP